MLERALQQQDADFDREISKLKKRKNLPSDTWSLLPNYFYRLLTYLSYDCFFIFIINDFNC